MHVSSGMMLSTENIFETLGIELRATLMISKCPPSELCPSLKVFLHSSFYWMFYFGSCSFDVLQLLFSELVSAVSYPLLACKLRNI